MIFPKLKFSHYKRNSVAERQLDWVETKCQLPKLKRMSKLFPEGVLSKLRMFYMLIISIPLSKWPIQTATLQHSLIFFSNFPPLLQSEVWGLNNKKKATKRILTSPTWNLWVIYCNKMPIHKWIELQKEGESHLQPTFSGRYNFALEMKWNILHLI